MLAFGLCIPVEFRMVGLETFCLSGLAVWPALFRELKAKVSVKYFI